MLTKSFEATYVPAVPSRPPRAEEKVCPPAPPGDFVPPGTPGQWVTICTTPTVLVGYDNGPATSWNPGPFPKPIYVTGVPTCRREFRRG